MRAGVARTDGFTLLELMVVLVLIGIIFSFAALSMKGDDLAQLMDREAGQLETLLGLASDEAILRGEELALYVDTAGYEFMTLAADGWQVPDDGLLRRYDMPADISLSLDVSGDLPTPSAPAGEDGEGRSPQVFILSSGEMTPFTVTFSSQGSRREYRVSTTLLGTVSREREERL